MATPSKSLMELFRDAAREKSCDELIEINAVLATELALIRERLEQRENVIKELQERLELISESSCKPPSTDDPEKPKGDRKGWKKKRKRGAQPGHKGHSRVLASKEKVSRFVDVLPDGCSRRQGKLTSTDEGPWRHQVWELPAPFEMLITEYRLRD